MMETTPHDMLGRIGALSSMIGTCTIPLGGLIAGYAGSVMDANHVFLIFGILMMIPGLLLLTQKKIHECIIRVQNKHSFVLYPFGLYNKI